MEMLYIVCILAVVAIVFCVSIKIKTDTISHNCSDDAAPIVAAYDDPNRKAVLNEPAAAVPIYKLIK